MQNERVFATTGTKSLRLKKIQNRQKQPSVQPVVQATGVPRYMLGLQRQYGNRFVQQVVALSRYDEGSTDVAPEVKQGIQQFPNDREALDSGSLAQRQTKSGVPEEKVSEAEKQEQRFKLFVENLIPRKSKSNWEKFSGGMDKLLLTLGHEKTIFDLSSKLKLNPRGRLLLNLVTNTGASIWLLQQGKIPNVIPEIPLADNLTLDVKVGGTPKKLDLMIYLKLKF